MLQKSTFTAYCVSNSPCWGERTPAVMCIVFGQRALAHKPQCWHLLNHAAEGVEAQFCRGGLRSWKCDLEVASWAGSCSATFPDSAWYLLPFPPLTMGDIARKGCAPNFVTGNSRRSPVWYLWSRSTESSLMFTLWCKNTSPLALAFINCISGQFLTLWSCVFSSVNWD